MRVQVLTSSPLGAFEQKAYENDIALDWDLRNENPSVNPASDTCIVFINEFAMEGFDRPSLADSDSDMLVLNVVSKCKNTIVIIHKGGIRLVYRWIDHLNIVAIIFAHLPGQDSGRALVQIMFGDQSPSGRLPYTMAKKGSDYGDLLDPSQPGGVSSNTAQFPQSRSDETRPLEDG